MKKFLPAILFYTFSLLLLFLLEKWEPSGPCTPGLGMLAFFFLFIPVSAGLCLYNICTAYKHKPRLQIAALHAVVLFAIVMGLW